MHSQVPAVDGYSRGVMLPSGIVIKNKSTLYEGCHMTIVYQVFMLVYECCVSGIHIDLHENSSGSLSHSDFSRLSLSCLILTLLSRIPVSCLRVRLFDLTT